MTIILRLKLVILIGYFFLQEYIRKWFTKSTILILIGYSFGERKFRKVNVGVYDSNEKSINLYKNMELLY